VSAKQREFNRRAALKVTHQDLIAQARGGSAWGQKAAKVWGFQSRANLGRKGELIMTVRPLHDRLIVKRIEEKETIKGGIIIPDSAKEKPQEGEVIAAGNGKKTEEGKVIPLDVKAGDRILFGKYSGTEIKIDDNEYLILREDEVLGVIESAKAAAGKK
jgi:chaperonin GroES